LSVTERYVSNFIRVLAVSSSNKTDRRYIAEMLLKVALNTISPNPTPTTYHIIIIRALSFGDFIKHKR